MKQSQKYKAKMVSGMIVSYIDQPIFIAWVVEK